MKLKKPVFYSLLGLFVAAIVGLDQWTKWLIVSNLALDESLPSILGIFHITHIKNPGAAWGILGGQLWLFFLVMVLFIALIAVMLWKKWLNKPFEWVCLAAIFGGGVGNLIDRLVYGHVTDMICLDFMSFPVFNVADCFITVGAIALGVYVIFFDREKKDEAEG